MVTRDELRNRLWPSDTFVDFERSLNTAVKKLRDAVDDSARTPRFIETLPRRGYRFIGPSPTPVPGPAADPAAAEPPRVSRSPRRFGLTLALCAALVGALTMLGLERLRTIREAGPPTAVVVSDFVNATKEPDLDGLSGILITSLEQSRALSVLTRPRMFDLARQMGRSAPEGIDETLGREICRYAGVKALAAATIRKFGDLYAIDLK